MIANEEKKLYHVLEELKISYSRYEHKPIYTIEEANQLGIDIPGRHCKNLFVRNRKGDTHYLVILEDTKRVDLKELSEQIGSSSLSLASEERLYKCLGVKPGSVTPFGLINDSKKEVQVLIDKDIESADSIGFHPNVNTATIVISFGDLRKFLEWSGNSTIYVKI